jgi:ribose transport system ATP-binding protein
MSTPRLRMEGVRKRFGPTVALDGVDLEVNAGEVLALVGENGAGKSTLMKVLSGAYTSDAGKMWLEGQEYAPKNPLDARRRGVAMIYQELSLAPHLSVSENILLGVEPRIAGVFLDWKKLKERSRAALAEVGRGDLSPDTIVGELSIADRQLVEIARAVANESKVLVLDEPTSSLTRKDIENLFVLVKKLRAQGHAIVYISHFLEEVRELCNRFTVLRDGQSVGSGAVESTPNEQIIALMVGRDVEDLYPRSKRAPGEVLLELNDLAGVLKPLDASLQLRRGEVLGIAGLVGAGRTELLRAMFGLDAVKSGRIRFESFSGVARPAMRWNQGMGLVSEDRKMEGLALGLSIEQNLTLTKLPFILSPRQLEEIALKWRDKMAVKSRDVRQPIGDLSGGNQQKVAIARLLHHNVDVLLLDEPTRGIDVGSKAQIYSLIDELANQGKAILMVSSYLPELLGTCDRIAVMSRGVLGPARLVAEIDEHSIMAEAIGAVDEPASNLKSAA